LSGSARADDPGVASEVDEMWSFVQSKQQQRWLWWASDHRTGQVLAYVLATHEDEAFVQLKALLEPFGIMQFYSDGWGDPRTSYCSHASYGWKTQYPAILNASI
jgi:IS1 family transposase